MKNMTQEFDDLRASIDALEALVPRDGGFLKCSRSLGVNWVFYGNRVAFLRLGFAMMQYAVGASLFKNSKRAEGRFLHDLFEPPSGITTAILQIDETPLPPEKEPSKMEVWSGALLLLATVLLFAILILLVSVLIVVTRGS